MIILNESKIKYEKLDQLLENQLTDIRYSNQVNIYIDLKEVIKKFFRPDIIPEIQNKKLMIQEISSDIINIVGHYRNYFYKKGKYTNFYFLYSFKECSELIELMPNYKKEYYNKYFHDKDNLLKIDTINRAIQVVQKVVNMIPNAYFIETSKHDELVYLRYLIEKTPSNQLNLILTNDDVIFQVLDKHTFILDLKGIKSSLISYKNAVSILSKKETELKACMIPLILSICGNKKYCFQNVPNVAIKKATLIVEELVESRIVLEMTSVEFPFEFAKLDTRDKYKRLLVENQKTISENYKLIRNDENLFKNKISIESDIASSGLNKSKSSKTFLELNAKIFSMYPLQLDMILKGEKL